MIKNFYPTVSTAMAFLVLFSTMSFTVEKHFCGKSLVDHAVFSSARMCKSEMDSCGVKKGQMAMGKNSCCSTKKETIDGQDELNSPFFPLDLTQTSFWAPITLFLKELLRELPLKAVPYQHYEPPQLVADIQVLAQVFLI